MSWQRALKTLADLNIGQNVKHMKTLTSSVTTSWGVHWDEDDIARDIIQNFFDANRARLGEVTVVEDGAQVTISAPATFSLSRLFYLGSEKGKDDVGQYGEGFKAAVMCLMRDHDIEPIALSGNDVVYMTISDEEVQGTKLKPILYHFFRSAQRLEGNRLILRGCSPKLREALGVGLDHFFHERNSLIDQLMWSSPDGFFAIYSSTTSDGWVFYRNLRRGAIPGIPVVLVINKEYADIEKNTRKDRDRNAFGEHLMKAFYCVFSKSAVKKDVAGQRIIVEAARGCWARGHPLLSEMANHRARWINWTKIDVEAVFGDRYYAGCTSRGTAEQIDINRIERQWQEDGRIKLPQYFECFGVITAHRHLEDLNAKALEESKHRDSWSPYAAEAKCIDLFSQISRVLAPDMMKVLHESQLSYRIARTESLLGEMKDHRPYRSHEVLLAAKVFEMEFPEAMAVFLHEHSHIFGNDGSRSFTDALTSLIAATIRSRQYLDSYESRWNQARAEVVTERGLAIDAGNDLESLLDGMPETALRELLARVPLALLRQLLPPPDHQ